MGWGEWVDEADARHEWMGTGGWSGGETAGKASTPARVGTKEASRGFQKSTSCFTFITTHAILA